MWDRFRAGGDDGDNDTTGGRSRWGVGLGIGMLVVAAAVVTAAVTGIGPFGDPGGEGSPATTPSATGVTTVEPITGTHSLADADVTIAGSGADEFGYGLATGDLNGDDVPDLVVGAPYSNVTGTHSGAVAVFYGPVDDAGDRAIEDADVWLPGEAVGDWAGNSLAVADVDGDGTGDLVVGAPRHNAGDENTGAVYVLYGGEDLAGERSLGDADEKVTGTSEDAMAGFSVAAANLTGDAGADLVIGAPWTDDRRGEVHLVAGERLAGIETLADADATVAGEAAGDEAGWAVAIAGDATGDGQTDVVVGARQNDAAGENAGAAYVLSVPFDDVASLDAATTVLRGPEEGARAGWSVAGPGDVTGDGVADILVGAPLASPGGAAYVAGGAPGERSLADAITLRGEAGGDRAGWVVAGVGDVTCDGTPDVLVGAPEHAAAGEDAGAVYLVATLRESRELADATAKLTGADPGDQAGRADALAVLPGDDTTGLVVSGPFGDPPQTVHVVYTACHNQ